ncbi:hypothetical protein GGS24DRAFT_199814 [Hypoxylon argillaceum]|nr:hypothetical protein GGS24DRAFT_199814 [Hypoxylon argillaceum]KAI1146429.1 hypothetical protein F4825DRAFT_195355 [Nemania diffusa]
MCTQKLYDPNLKPLEKPKCTAIECRDLCSAKRLATMTQIPSFKIHPPKAVPGRRCQCQCQKALVGKLAVCKDGTVGNLDPELVLCDICFFELKEVNNIRHMPTCQYPPDTLDRIWSPMN